MLRELLFNEPIQLPTGKVRLVTPELLAKMKAPPPIKVETPKREPGQLGPTAVQQLRVVAVLKNGPLDMPAIAKALGLNSNHATAVVARMRKRGKVVAFGKKGAYQYRLAVNLNALLKG